MNRIDLEKHNVKNENTDQDFITLKADLRRTQEKLQWLKENFDRAFQTCRRHGHIRVSDDTFLEINVAYTQIMGYESGEILG